MVSTFGALWIVNLLFAVTFLLHLFEKENHNLLNFHNV